MMKTISGKVTSSNPISLSKATSVLATFVAAETGASQAMAVYLRRTVGAFNELTQLHRELKGSKSGRKHKRAKEEHENHRLPESTNERDIEAESHKKKKNKKEREEMSSLEFEEERREEKKKKKRKDAEVEEGGVGHSEEQLSKKKRKKSD